jgi:Multicopper oxidase
MLLDVHHLGPSHNTWFTARFGPHDGDYMYHCHNIVHEDSSMMVAFRTGGESPDAPEKWDPSVGAGAHPVSPLCRSTHHVTLYHLATALLSQLLS